MRAGGVVFAVALTVMLTGCAGVVSLHPAAAPDAKEVVFEAALTGVWEEVKAGGDGVRTRYSLVQRGSGYDVTVKEGPKEIRGLQGTMQLLKAGDRYLMDVYCPSDWYPPPVHIFFKLRWEKDRAWAAEMQSDWFKEQIRTRGQPRHEVLREDAKDPDRIVLTASSAELRRYLLPYLAEDRAFDDETELRRLK
jgi:hypothetical protein